MVKGNENEKGFLTEYRRLINEIVLLKAGDDPAAIGRLVEMAERVLNGKLLSDKRILAIQLLTSIPEKTIIHILPALTGRSLAQFLLVLDVPTAKSLIRKLTCKSLIRTLNEADGGLVVQLLYKLFGEELVLILANLPDSALSGIRQAIGGNETGVCAEESQPIA